MGGQTAAEPSIAVDTPAAAHILCVSTKTLANWRARAMGVGPPFVKYPGRNGPVRYLVADLHNWLAQHRVGRSQEHPEMTTQQPVETEFSEKVQDRCAQTRATVAHHERRS